MALTSYAQVQAYIVDILTRNISSQTGQTEQADSESAPHGAFWSTLTYDQFVNGAVPGVSDPNTGGPMPILIKGNAAKSNFILALQGAAGTPFDPKTGDYGRMPADGPPYLDAKQIQPLADWINAGCPER